MSEENDWTEEELEKDVNSMTAITIPVNLKIEGHQQILDLAEMEEILRGSQLIALGNCGCRKKRQKCSAPLDVCLSLDRDAEEFISNGTSKKISLEEALDALKRSHEAGLVHIVYITAGVEKPEMVCSCCSCCCWSMSALVRLGMQNAVVASSSIALDNPETCSNCGTCVERCQFKARSLINGEMKYDEKRCFGCGVCISTCPTQSISLVKRLHPAMNQ